MELLIKEPKTSRRIEPQVGGQEVFLSSPADIAVFGGVAGAGKSFALLLDPVHYVNNSEFGATIFRRTCPQITNQGGLWDTSMKIYPYCGAGSKETTLEWVFRSGARVKFAHMQYEKDRFDWDGAQIALIGFDQLEHFTWRQFSYMLSRSRSLCGIRPYIRATCNPDPDHFLRSLMGWWIDDDTGYAIPQRGGIIRWFVVLKDEVLWANSAEEAKRLYGPDTKPKSFTFIPGDINDNQIMLKEDPGYLPNLYALPLVDRERLLRGNWNIRETAGTFFQRGWFEIVNAAPALVDEIRYWDRASTQAKPGQPASGSWSAGLRMGKDARGVFYVTDVNRFQGSPLVVESTIKNIATQDGKRVSIGLEQDPGQAGKAEVLVHVRNLAGFNAIANSVRESKGSRAKPLSAQAEAGNVKLVRGGWNEAFLQECEAFDGTDRCTSDQVDAASGAFYLLTSVKRAGAWGR